jgi:hypothetical protein
MTIPLVERGRMAAEIVGPEVAAMIGAALMGWAAIPSTC